MGRREFEFLVEVHGIFWRFGGECFGLAVRRGTQSICSTGARLID